MSYIEQQRVGVLQPDGNFLFFGIFNAPEEGLLSGVAS
jgi:hypothetical protein